jgi:hypothetical protein
LPEELGASPLEMFLRSKEILGEVEGVRRPFRREPDAVLPRDIGKAVCDTRAALEDYTFHFRPDRPQCSADIVTAVEETGAAGIGDGLTCRGHQRLEPAGTHVAAGIWGADQQNGTADTLRGAQCGDCLGERVNDDGGDSVRVQASPPK